MTIGELNEKVESGAIDELILVTEARQRKLLSKIADKICEHPDVRVVLLSGRSAAGKTTTATRLCTQLRVNDREAIHFSTDDYFVGDALNPRDENGELDYEHIDCVDIRALTADLAALMRGESVRRRTFDFVNHCPRYPGDEWKLPEGAFVVVEGIHALNPRLSEGLDEKCVFRVFIDPEPDIDLFMGIRPSSSDARLLRRIVRDNQYRHTSPANTFAMWPKVLAGERKWIDPYCGNADATFNSYLTYELCALRPYVGGLLEMARNEIGDRSDVTNMIRLVSAAFPIDSSKIPGDSILREAIGNSQLEY